MLKPVTPWTSTVRSDLENTEPFFNFEKSGNNFVFYNTGDSIWLVAEWNSGGRIAFRIAFGMNSPFENIIVKEDQTQILITAETRLGKYKIFINTLGSDERIFRYTTTFKASLPLLIKFWPRDIVPLTKEGSVENTTGKVHVQQAGGRSGQLYFSMTKPKNGSVFYFQNLSAMSSYCEACEASVADSVGGEWPEIGFQFPINAKKPVPAATEFTISDAFVILDDQVPEKDSGLATQFLECLAEVYNAIPKPDTTYHDWPDIAEKALKDLHLNKGCWTQTDGISYLNAYVADYKTPAEIMVQLAVLVPLQEYLRWKGESHSIVDDLNSGLPKFYDNTIKSIVRWHPAREDELDASEEQKKEMVMDSWYLHHPLLNLSRLALSGDKSAEKLFIESIDYAVKVAKHFKYKWPVFYKMTTLEVLKAETSPGNGGEKDVPGSYAHVMLMAFKITGEKKYLKEAVIAVKQLEGLGFDIFYQANNTAFAAGALIELYKETDDEHYLELSYCCLAAIFKNVQLWECEYGNAKHFPNFFAVFPLNDAPYTAAYEELEVYAALYNYIILTKDMDILPSLRILIPEFIKYAVNRLPYYFPPMLPHEIISKEIKTGEVKKDLWMPLEDMRDGWELNGQVGQEVYGVGLSFGIVPRQYHKIKGTDLILFCDYPLTNLRGGKNKVTFQIIGDDNFKAQVKIIYKTDTTNKKFKLEQKISGKYEKVNSSNKSNTEFTISAHYTLKFSW